MPNAAMVGLQSTGTLSYNGYVFDGAYHLNINSSDVYDESGRIVMYVKYTINVTAIVADAVTANVEQRMQQIQDTLTQSGQTLIIKQKGFSTGIDTSVQSGRDVNFGPKPLGFHWRPIGDTLAVEISWSCEVCLAKCGGNRNTGVLGINYEISVNINRHGNAVRTINGYVLVANSVIGNAIENNPEIILPSIFKAPVPSHFYREVTRKFNYGKNRVDFTITDTEIPTNRPQNDFATEITGSHNVHWGRTQGLQQFNTLSLKVTTRADVNPSQAWLIALDVFQQRIQAGLTNQKNKVLLLDIDATELIWERSSEFTFKWRIIGPVEDLIGNSGMWTPITTSKNPTLTGNWDWDKWQTAMAKTAFSPYGNSQWKFNSAGGDDIVINLCSNTNAQSTVNGNTTNAGWAQVPTYGFQNYVPDANYSYLDYYMWIETDFVRGTASQSILQKPETDFGSPTMTDDSAFSPGASGTLIKNIVQQASKTTYYVTLKGFAHRAGHQIPCPTITSIGGETPVKVNGFFKNLPTKNALGVVIYSAQWSIRYAIAGVPSVVTALANPSEGITVKNGNGYTLGSNGVAANPPQDVNNPGPLINGQ